MGEQQRKEWQRLRDEKPDRKWGLDLATAGLGTEHGSK